MPDLTNYRILAYMAAAHRVNPDAEVSGAELQRELNLDAGVVNESVAQMAGEGLVESDLFLSNLWLSITDKGLIAAARFDPPVATPVELPEL